MKTRKVALRELQALAHSFAEKALPLTKRAKIVGLIGELGAGKTAFVKEVAGALGVRHTVTSPTFVIEKIYPLKGKKFKKLIHIDAYRLSGGHDLTMIGWDEISRDPGNLIFIEWPEKVSDILPLGFTKIHLAFVDENTREITL